MSDEIDSRIVRLTSVPKMETALEDSSVQPFAHLAALTVRTFELTYTNMRTEVILSAAGIEDMRNYAGLLSSVYGSMKFGRTDTLPSYLEQLPRISGLVKHQC